MRAPTVIALYLLLASSLWAAEEERCGTCHPEARVAFAASIHSREGVRCASCHRGEPQSLEIARAHGGDFRTMGDRALLPEACGECHADLARMRPYNLPADQLALYRTSQHGLALARGVLDAAVCTDCHGSHEIRAREDAHSSVYPANVVATCARCHDDGELAERHHMDPNVVSTYRSSIHGIAVLENRNFSAPNCIGCHGFHGATPPGFGDIDKVCGKCHPETRRAFLEGPHYPGMLAAGLPERASCHGHHAIRVCGADCETTLCLDCHQQESEPVVRGRKLRTLFDTAAAEVEVAEELAAEAERVPLEVEDYLARLEEARTYLTTAAPLVHSLSLHDVEDVTRRARSIGEEVQHELYAQMDRKGEHLGLVLFWFYLLVTLAILFNIRRRLE